MLDETVGLVLSGTKSNKAYSLYGLGIEPEYDPLIYPDPVYLKDKILCWLTNPIASNKVILLIEAVLNGKPFVLNLNL